MYFGSKGIMASIAVGKIILIVPLAVIVFIRNGMSSRDAKLMALFIEETAGNIIEHGKPRLFHKLRADYRLSYSSGKICVTLRDYCGHFDPSAFYEAHKDDSPENLSGIKIVMGLADDVRYFNAFNSNNIMIYIDTVKGESAS